MILDTKKLEQINKDAKALYYEVVNLEKTVRVYSTYENDDFTYDHVYKPAVLDVYDNYNKSIIHISNMNTRQYHNIFDEHIEYYNADISDILNKSQKAFCDEWDILNHIDYTKEGIVCDFDYFYNMTDREMKKAESIIEYINKKIGFFIKECRDYSQGDYDCYIFYYIKNKDNKEIEKDFDILDYLFTCGETRLDIKHTEKRKYIDGSTIDEVIFKEYDSLYNFHGLDSYKDIMKYVSDNYKDYIIDDCL